MQPACNYVSSLEAIPHNPQFVDGALIDSLPAVDEDYNTTEQEIIT